MDTQIRRLCAPLSCCLMAIVLSACATMTSSTGRGRNVGALSQQELDPLGAQAFALPGGQVGVNTGMFPVARTQDQLAAVIGHEIGHLGEHHFEERITNQVRTSQVLALFGAVAGGIAANAGFLLPNSRAQENGADLVGQRLMAQAGLDPRQAVTLWQNMLSAGSNRPPQWRWTHPDPQARIRQLQARAAALVPTWEAAHVAGRAPHCV